MKRRIIRPVIALFLSITPLAASENGAIREESVSAHFSMQEGDGSTKGSLGARIIAHSQFVSSQEKRAEMERAKIEEISSLSSSVRDSEEEMVVKKLPSGEELICKALYSSHEGAFHRPVNISAGGDMITLEDGSIWKVRPDDKAKTLDWLAGDTIFILPNHSWFSSYYYVLSNQNTGAEVCVNLMLPPLYNGNYSHWIVAIDLYNLEVGLDDGSVWKISSSDYSTIEKWKVNDTIVIGVNDSWFSSKPNILINVFTHDNAAAVTRN